VSDVRYITLAAGNYAVVARDVHPGELGNAFSIKVRQFKGSAIDNGTTRAFVKNRVVSAPVAPSNWDGFHFNFPEGAIMWIEGVFSRGADHLVHWEIIPESELAKFVAKQPHKIIRSGQNPTKLGFQFSAPAGKYFFVVRNDGTIFSAFAVTREFYQ
jgi:hypothetical protein